MDKWVRVMADYCSDGLWQRDGCMMDRDDLPVSERLKTRHIAWCEAYEENDDHLPKYQRKFDIERHALEGLEIAKLIKAELPEWTVIYFDESRLTDDDDDNQPRDEFEYEV